MKNQQGSFWSDGLSINETRVSSLLLMMWLFGGLAGYSLIVTGDIPYPLVQIFLGLVTAIAGVNIVDSISKRPAQSKQTQEDHRGTPTI